MPRADAVTSGFDLSSLPGAPPGAATPKDGVKSNKRKQTLLSLLDALQELSREGDLELANSNQKPSFEDDRDVPTVDEHLQKVGAESFSKFERRIINLDKELRNFANAARQLGSSVGILSSSFHLRERLAQILFLFRENAADLFPRKVHRQPREGVMNPSVRPRRKAKSVHIARPAILDDLDAEDFPDQLQGLAEDVIIFLDCLNEFPEFTDEGVNTSITSLEGDLKYWASCLKAYEGQFKYPAVQRYLHDLTSEMGEHLDSITSSLQIFIEIGVPTIRFAQKHAAANLLNLSTVATFFSAVTATTMQFSFDQVDGPLQNSVNGFWFTSLVFSIGAAVNSLLGLTWKQAMYRSPGHRVPWWVLIWIKRSPLVFLVLSVACFSMGLVLFAYSSGQHRITSTVTTVFSACSCFGLAAVSCWFASERIIFTKHKGEKWLADVLSETKVQMHRMPGVGWVLNEPRNAARKISFWTRRRYHDFTDYVSAFTNAVFGWVARIRHRGDDLESADDNEGKSPISPHSFSPEPMSPRSHRPSDATATALSPISERAPSTVDGHDDPTVVNDNGATPLSTPTTTSPARTRFTNIVRSVMMMRNASTPTAMLSNNRKRTMSADHGKGRPTEPPSMVRRSRVAALIPQLKQMEAWLDLSPHQALVRHLQFSPNGRYLATSSWDRTSVIFKIGEDLAAPEPITAHRTLAHPQGFVGQVAWSPNGHQLLTKMGRGVKVWTEDGVCKRTIDRAHNVQSIAWMPSGDAFLSVEGAYVTKLDTNGKILGQYVLDRMILHDVAVTMNSQRMLCVGTLTASSDGLQPKKSRAEKQIIVYNLDRNEIENRVPVLHEVRDITMARVGDVALVSYENKAPPQLWKLEYYKDTARLQLRHTYMPKVTVDFAGPSYFGGKNDELVLCAGKAGDIHIWDRESGTLLHHIRPQVLGGGDLTCIAWNPSADPFMFATGTHDGGVHLWTTLADGREALRLLDDAPSRGSTHPTPTPRTSSPNIFESDFRADSPSQANEPQDGLLSPHSISGSTISREQRVVFRLTNPP
ncbi:WD40 repeat domain-containing protein [Phanerochaete sordida]|uniref:WD40 repeat domain-containing protein n=1 Tax=Phanerochaete sordida TaxID=48140 RepID=A0A9P3LJL1_9APHY|nr:WD40 repeat domain-containing protein [Phanerochaete sordida]